jgi:LmbE family N-acetylglucosaminyl deacetylase
MSLLKFILSKASPIPKLESFSRYLFIGPHPDDIEIGCGATVSKLASMGKEISFLICLDGRYGLDFAPEGTTPEDLVRIRQAESLESAKRLGVTDVHFLGLSDGGFYMIEDLRSAIAVAVGNIKPQVIFSVDPDVPNECHIDHLNVGQQSKIIANFASNKEIMSRYGAQTAPVEVLALYMTAKPNRYIRTSGHIKKQLDSVFDVHLSQFPKGCSMAASITKYIKLRAFFFGLRTLKGRAEGFRVMDGVRMHCFPEG